MNEQSTKVGGKRRPFRVREPFCGLSHFTGAALSVVALVVLLVLARGRFWPLVGCALYGGSMIVLYLASALSHSLHVSERVQQWLARFDYMAIFLLIAGTFAPICLIPLRGPWGWGVLAAEYAIALAGVVLTVIWKEMPHWIRLILYVGMGSVMVALLPLLHIALPTGAIHWLLAGSLVYMIGMGILALDHPKLWPGRNPAHSFWHLFVMAGSACHFVLVARLIIPVPS